MKHSVKITLLLISFFVIAQLIGLFIVDSYVDVQKSRLTGKTEIRRSLPYGIERPDVEEDTSFIFIIFAILIGTGLLLLLIRFRAMLLWKVWYGLAIFISLLIAFGAFLSDFFSVLIALVFAFWKVYRPNILVHNFTELFLYGGLAAIFTPIINIRSGVILLLLISAYDMYAVWKSKHMVKLAKFQTDSKLFAGLLVPYKMPGLKMRGVATKVKTAVLGGGDIGIPLIFAGVILKTSGFTNALIVVLFATIALSLLLFFSQKDRFYPAMPFISAGCLLGYFVTLLGIV